jgi:hypothetical protein
VSEDLAKSERLAREVVLRKGDWTIDHESLAMLMAEYERRGQVEAVAWEVVNRYRRLLSRDVWKIVDSMDTGLGHLLTKLCRAVDPPDYDA